MPKLKNHFPKMCRHHRGQAFVKIGQRQIWLGPWGSEEARERYDWLIAEWLANGRTLPPEQESASLLTINDVLFQFWEQAKTRYTEGELGPMRLAFRVLRNLYGSSEVCEFGPNKLRAVRASMIEKNWSRTNINRQINRIRLLFRWASSFELVPVTVYRRLQTLEALRRGEARETAPVKPAPRRSVRMVRRHLPRPIRAMIDIQLLSGCRPGELVGLRPLDIDMNGDVWRVELENHKNAYRGKTRILLFGPKAQRIIGMFLNRPVDKPLFSPKDANRERNEKADTHRRENQKPNPKLTEREVGDSYTVASYRRAIDRAIDGLTPEGLRGDATRQWRKAHRFSPHQLRHSAATYLRRQFGLETAKAVLGHSTITSTQIYAEVNERAAIEAIAKVG